jgi:hypothetical protein
MTLTLDGLVLPIDLVWVDEFDWTPTEQHQTRTLSGALVFETTQRQGGRPITLADGSSPVGIEKVTLDALYQKLSITTPLLLGLQNGSTFNVTFIHESKPIEAKPLNDYQVMIDEDLYQVTIRLITV